jgi:7-cyano-7-deazaguanine synthase
MKNQDAVILFSGGLDSTTSLYWAKDHFRQVFAVTFKYQQRHVLEVTMAEIIAEKLHIPFDIIELPLKNIAYSSLTNSTGLIPASLAASKNESGVPHTYVPFRNGIFLSLAAAYAESRDICHLITGFNQIDTPDYPDTTADFVEKMQAAINQGTAAAISGNPFKIHTPLIAMSKAEIIQFGLKMGADYSHSISCYRGQEHPCMACPSCDIRQTAFNHLNMEDPLISRLKKEGKL